FLSAGGSVSRWLSLLLPLPPTRSTSFSKNASGGLPAARSALAAASAADPVKSVVMGVSSVVNPNDPPDRDGGPCDDLSVACRGRLRPPRRVPGRPLVARFALAKDRRFDRELDEDPGLVGLEVPAGCD